MEDDINREELLSRLSEFRGAGMAIGIPLFALYSIPYHWYHLVQAAYVGEEIVAMLRNVIEKQSNR